MLIFYTIIVQYAHHIIDMWYSSNVAVVEDTDTNDVALEPAKVSSTHDLSWLYGTLM